MAKSQTGERDVVAVNLEREDALSSVGRTLLSRVGDADEPKPGQQPNEDALLMLVISGNGTVSAVLPGEGAPPDSLDVDSIPGSIADIWPEDICERVTTQVQRAIRARRVQSLDVAVGESEGSLKLIFVPHGRDSSIMIVLDTSARESAYTRMLRLAYVDRATELPTREYLLEEFERFTGTLGLLENRAALICLGLDADDASASSLNGPGQDAVLKELASRLTFALRGANDRSEKDLERYTVAARIDYRNYGVILPCIETAADAESVAQRLLETLQSPVEIGGRRVVVKVSAGIALYPQDGADAQTLLDNSLSALEDAVNMQPGSYKFFSGTLKLRALQRRDLEAELKTALDRQELSLHYLPIVDAETERVVSVEALLRWPQAMFGAKEPLKIVALAERTGLMGPIGDWVVSNGIEQLKRWHDDGHVDLRLAINLSMQQFVSGKLPAHIYGELSRHELDAARIDVEITEYLLFRDALKDYVSSRALSDLGVGVVVDDYGTGACSIAHFSRSPVTAVKIHNSFVSSALTDGGDRAACAAMTGLAHTLGRLVIAEGVETREQADLLKSQGCDLLQGFLYSQPLPAEELSNLLACRNKS